MITLRTLVIGRPVLEDPSTGRPASISVINHRTLLRKFRMITRPNFRRVTRTMITEARAGSRRLGPGWRRFGWRIAEVRAGNRGRPAEAASLPCVGVDAAWDGRGGVVGLARVDE